MKVDNRAFDRLSYRLSTFVYLYPESSVKQRTIPVLVFLSIVIGLSGCQAIGAPTGEHNGEMEHNAEQAVMTERQAAIAEKGAAVMPFDLDATTHSFEKNDEGGLQQVIADNPDDAEQIALIRTHLAEEAERFQRGDFHDLQMIHGGEMAGLHALMVGTEIVYSDLLDGAQILYTTTDIEWVNAIISWFDAQVPIMGRMQRITDRM